MNGINLRSVDLNLLTVFQAIYDHGHITRAAESLGLTQPAASHALKRLRALFNDELFVRAKRRMNPTPHAHEIARPIAEILGGIQLIIGHGPEFDPATTKREIRIGMLDYGMTLFATAIAGLVKSEAPGLTIDFRHTQTDAAVEMLDDGDLDLFIGPVGAIGDGFEKRVLMRNDCVVVTRRDHRFPGRRMSLRDFTDLDHVRIANLTVIDDRVESYLRRQGYARRVVMTLPHYSSALFVVSRNDFAVTITHGPAELYRDFLGLTLHKPPFPLDPHEVAMLRHRRSFNDPLIEWLWDRIFVSQSR
jgi:DNA-binding transcriptional LysR family regulator